MLVSPAKRLAHRLARVRPGQQRVVTCYVRLEPGDRTGRRCYREVKAAIDALARDIPDLGRTGRAAVERDFRRILDYLADPANLPRTRGVALFACSPLRLFGVVPLPRVSQTRVAVAPTPVLEELRAVEREFGRVLAVVLDREHARFFDVTAFDVTELPCLRSPSTRGGRYHSDRHGSPGWGERDYHNRMRTERRRHYLAATERLSTLQHGRPVAGIFLAGPGNVAAAVRRLLPPALSQKVLGTARLNPKLVTAADVAAAVASAREASA